MRDVVYYFGSYFRLGLIRERRAHGPGAQALDRQTKWVEAMTPRQPPRDEDREGEMLARACADNQGYTLENYGDFTHERYVEAFLAGRASLRARVEELEADRAEGYKVLAKVEHDNNQALYCLQVERIVNLEALLAQAADLVVLIKTQKGSWPAEVDSLDEALKAAGILTNKKKKRQHVWKT